MDELSNEEKEDLAAKVLNARKLKALIEHTGWTDVLLPRFKQLRMGLIDSFLTEKHDLNSFLLIQQSVNAVDNILKGIDLSIAAGELAGKTLKNDEESK